MRQGCTSTKPEGEPPTIPQTPIHSMHLDFNSPLLLHNTDGKKLKESCHQWEAVFHSIHSICSILFRLLFTCCCGQRSENKQIRQGLSSTVFSVYHTESTPSTAWFNHFSTQVGELSCSSRKATDINTPERQGTSHLRYLSAQVPLSSGTPHLRTSQLRYLSAQVPLISGTFHLRYRSSQVPLI